MKKWLLKVCVAGCIAFVILNLLTCFYRNASISIEDETKSAPTKHEPNSFFIDFTEGHTFGFHDKNGFNNAYPVGDSIDYLCMGSSQMEAKEVMPNQNCVFILNQKLNKDKDENSYAYSIGTSGERLPECISRLPYAIDTYQPKKSIIIETGQIDFSQAEIDKALLGVNVGELQYAFNSGIMSYIRKLPYVRLAYIQLRSMKENRGSEVNTDDLLAVEKNVAFDADSYTNRITPLIKKAAQNSGDVPLLIFYHPEIEINKDGTISSKENKEMIRQFQLICEENGINFLDMTEVFVNEYDKNKVLPYGFANTPAGSGHLNKFGHSLIAEELYKYFLEVK